MAVIKGFELVGPSFSNFIVEAKKISPDKKVLIHCWRGGLRSNIMAWVLKSGGFETHVLKGGYKTYRRWALEIFHQPKNLVILGGLTGSGKTFLLNELNSLGEQTIDLESLAHHKGSAFGALGMMPHPTNEQFENNLAMLWATINPDKILWLEDESQNIGKIKIPDSIYKMMRQAKVIKVNIPFDIRLNKLIEDYTRFPKKDLIEGTMKIAKRLGHLRLSQSLEYLDNNDMESWVKMMLEYYDKAYLFGLSQREQDSIIEIALDARDWKLDAKKILDHFKKTL
jgi:tRNA 2-selenouridine synthase